MDEWKTEVCSVRHLESRLNTLIAEGWQVWPQQIHVDTVKNVAVINVSRPKGEKLAKANAGDEG